MAVKYLVKIMGINMNSEDAYELTLLIQERKMIIMHITLLKENLN